MNDLQIAVLPNSALKPLPALHGLSPQTMLLVDLVADKPPQTYEKSCLSIQEIWKIRRNATLIRKLTSDKRQQITQDVVSLQISRMITSNADKICKTSWGAVLEAIAAKWASFSMNAYSDELAWLYGRHLELLDRYELEQGP
jgi:hypothetical protein